MLTFQRVIALTSIDPGRLQGDLADRLLAIELARIDEDSRAADQSIADAWRGRHAGVLAGLLDFAAQVLAVLPAIRTTGSLPRMADYARILLAVDQILGTDGYRRYADQAGQIAEQVADADSVALAIRKRVTARWEGTASELLVKLATDHPPKDWPATPQGMGGRLSRAAPALRAPAGWSSRPIVTATPGTGTGPCSLQETKRTSPRKWNGRNGRNCRPLIWDKTSAASHEPTAHSMEHLNPENGTCDGATESTERAPAQVRR